MSAQVIEAAGRFPRAALVLRMSAIAAVLCNAGTELDELAGTAHAYEIGTLRRKARAVVLAVIASAESSRRAMRARDGLARAVPGPVARGVGPRSILRAV